MTIKGAMTVLKKDMEFLGLTFDQVITFIAVSYTHLPMPTIYSV